MTEVLPVDPQHPDAGVIARAADTLRNGGLVAFPTETVYGLGGHALDRDAVRRIFDAKGRPANDPLIIHIHDVSLLDRLVSAPPPIVETLAARFWPGPLTIVLFRGAGVPDEVTAGLETVAIRVPAHPVARALLEAAALPVAAPSANLFSRPSPTRAEHVLEDLNGRIDLLLDGGPTTVGVESTVLDLTAPVPTVLRPGAVSLEMLTSVLPDVRNTQPREPSGAMKSPGLLAKHYSPRAPLTLYEGPPAAVVARIDQDAAEHLSRGRKVGLALATDDRLSAASRGARIERLGPAANLDMIAANLYSALRALDAAGVEVILARNVTAEDAGLGAAIRDRLHRAAAGRIIRVGT